MAVMTTSYAEKYKVGLGEVTDGTWTRGGVNVSKFGHIVIQKVVIDGNIKEIEDTPEAKKGEMGFNRDTFTYIPKGIIASTFFYGSGSGVEGIQGIDIEHTIFADQGRINREVMDRVRDDMVSLEGTT